MTTKDKRHTRDQGRVFALAALFCLLGSARAAPGNLSQIPLFLGTAVPPNIFFVLDDSFSMDWEVLQTAGAREAHPSYDNEGRLVDPPTSEMEILEHCVGYNVLAYDPTVTYTPWEGVDDNNDAYAGLTLTLTTARDDPYDSSDTDDISDRFYFPWTDSDADGEYDLGECPQPDPATYGGDIDASDCAGAGCVAVSSLDAAGQTNFANWYSYYRKREYVLKRAVSAVINDSDDRVGMASLNDTGNASTQISDMSDTAASTIAGCASITNKECLLQKLYQLDSLTGGSTPLRRALDEAGKYFDDTDAAGHEYLAGAPNPILDASEGGECQQNFTVLLSDGYWNQPWAGSYGNADSDNNSLWDSGAQADGTDPALEPTTCNPPGAWWPGGPFPFPTKTDTLADIAMHFYEKDLSALADSVNPVQGIDLNRAQHMVTFAVAFGTDGNLTDNPPNRDDDFPWPPICPNTSWTVDDMRHAAWNSRGQFLSALRPTSVSEALTNTIASISQRQATESEVVFNTGSLSTDTLLFQATFDSTDWSGDLLAYDAEDLLADIQDDGIVDIDPVWRAAELLDGLSNTRALQRLVLTYERDGADPSSTMDGVPVVWDQLDQLTAAQQDDLRFTDAVTPPTDPDAVGEARLAFLLGDRSCEAEGEDSCTADTNGSGTVDDLDKSLRERGSRLGDIVNGGPVVVGIPELNWPATAPFPDGTSGTTTYADFKTNLTASPREEVVYAGANDGMLHGFRTSDGQEVLAYLPAGLAASAAQNEGYHGLSDPNYTHRYYVDRTPAVSDVYMDPGTGVVSWRTVAVGGLGAGGRGLYALDITNPTSFSAGNAADLVLWEFTDSDDPELGLTVSEPVIAMMNNGKWAVIVGSGYNDTGPDPDAHLFILFLEEGLDGIWTIDSDYLRLEAPEDPAIVTLANRNGLSSPAVADLDGNGTADRIYAGDLFGNLWAFDVCDANAGGVCSNSTADWVAANAGLSPIFTAELGGLRQPITHKPAISKHPTVGDLADNQPNVMVYFGTGQYLTDADLTNTDPQSFYGIWDSGDLSLTRASLQQQTIDANFANQEVLTDNSVNWTTQYGWYIDLPDAGERVVVDPVLRANILFFNSLVPSTLPCAGGGTSFLYAVDMENGGRPDFAPFDTNNDGVVDTGDLVSPTGPGDDEAASRKVYAEGSGGIASETQVLGDTAYTALSTSRIAVTALFEIDRLDKGRLSWQELSPF